MLSHVGEEAHVLMPSDGALRRLEFVDKELDSGGFSNSIGADDRVREAMRTVNEMFSDVFLSWLGYLKATVSSSGSSYPATPHPRGRRVAEIEEEAFSG